MAVTAGTNINQYRIISSLGSGGMGEVYLAQDVRLGRKVALKLLYEDVTRGDDWVRRFEQEARATSSLNHPNIITIYEVGQADGSHFISTEFIDGQTLRQHLNHNVMTLREALDISIQIATALATAHDAGIVHRDIKPENVMLRADGYVKVLDFGLAKFIEKRLLGFSNSDPDAETQDFVNTHPGAVMGTISYMSPEQARGTNVDARSDIFSLGILLYEMLTGHQPFEGTSASDVIVSILQKKPKPIARFSQDVPIEIERIVGKALSKDREERYQTVKDMLIDLKRLKRGLELEEETSDEHGQELSRQLLSSSTGGSSGGVRVSQPDRDSRERISREQPTIHTEEVTVQPTASGSPATLLSSNTSSAEYIFKGIRQHRKIALIVIGAIIVALAAFLYYRATRPIDSIAVLPFHSGNAEAENEQLGDEISRQVSISLSRLSPDLRVIPFNSVRQLKGKSPQEVGRELNVRAILTVEAKRNGESVTISSELVDLRDNRLLWGDTSSTKMSDLTLAPQTISAAVSKSIGLKLSAEGEKRREAESLYMRGRNAWNKRKGDAIKEAAGYFSEALKLDPNYAQARAGLADCYNMFVTYGVSAPKDDFPKARDEAKRALTIDNKLAEAHAALAYTTFRGDWNWTESEKEFKEAIRLNDEIASAHQWYASYLAAMSRFREAIEETRRAQELEKTSAISSHLGLIYFLNERFDDSIKASQQTLERDPNFYVARRYLGMAYAQKGMYKEALEQYEKVVADSTSGSPLMKAEYASVLALNNETEKAKTELDKLLLMREKRERYISPYHIAAIYVALKDRDSAFEWLKKGMDERADWMVFLKVDPRFKSLRSDAQFTKLLQQMKLE